MPYTADYTPSEPSRKQVDDRTGCTLVEFGAPWCGYCITAQPLVQRALEAHPEVAHLKIEDGSGRPLGRSYRIKLWPTLVLVRDGEELGRVVRPRGQDELTQLMAAVRA